jgi:hypothetical protein
LKRTWLLTLALLSPPTAGGFAYGQLPVDAIARVIDATTRAPIADAIITIGEREIRTDADGAFLVDLTDPVGIRAPGYQRLNLGRNALRGPDPQVSLAPFRPKALYLSIYGVGTRSLRDPALELADTTEVNAFVIDVKGDRGLVAYRSSNPLAGRVGAQKVITIPDLPTLVTTLHDRGLYVIARIVVFKDDPLATGRLDLAVHKRDGSLYRDREGLAWSDPYNHEVWDYNIALAVEAAQAGFDEIQFDYVRLPDARNLRVPQPDTETNRVAAIDGFLTTARAALRRFNVFVAADIFGYVCWNTNDTGIGQRLEHVLDRVDYISPMLYPSSFQFGIPGYPNPVAHPYQIVRLSLEEAIRRTHISPLRIRPWLQAFPDYAFGGSSFTRGEVRTQIKASDDVGTNGWMLWNPRNRYTATDLQKESKYGAPR